VQWKLPSWGGPTYESDSFLSKGKVMSEVLGIVPFIPGGRDFKASCALFRELGFEELWSNGGYAGFRSGAASFILQDLDDARFAGNLMVKIEVRDLDLWFEEMSAKDLVGRFPGFRMNPPTEFPWGREVHFIDLAGVCWHVGLP
jgi:hypothetical protein